MPSAESETLHGAVAALVVATAPDAVHDTAPQAPDLLWRTVAGRPLFVWPLWALAQLEDVDFLALVVPPERQGEAAHIVGRAPLRGRVDAVLPSAGDDAIWRHALAALEGLAADCEWILALDATMPLVTSDAIHAGLRAAGRTGVAIAAEPVKETLKRLDGASVAETLPRDALRRLLPLVIFRREALDRALAATPTGATKGATDLIALAQLAGVPLTTFDAGYPAVRVTSEDDLAIVETLLRQRPLEARPS